MKDKILALLTTKFTGVRKDGLNQIATVLAFQVDTDEKATELVGKMTAEQVNSFITDWRKDADAEIDKANQTRENNLRKKFDFVEKKIEQPVNNIPEMGNIDAAAIQKLITDSIAAATKPLLEKVNAFEKDGISKTRLQSLNDKLKDCKDDNFKALALKNFARMQFESDDEFTEYLTETENDVKVANQNSADSGLSAQGRPIVANTPPTAGKEATPAELDAVFN